MTTTADDLQHTRVPDPEYRTVLDGQLRAVNDDDHVIEARICAYGVGPDTYNTTWRAGWAADAVRAVEQGEYVIPVVFGHDERNISNVVGSVIGLRDVTDDGLYAQMRMANFDEVPAAKVAYSLLRDGHLRGWSYKFRDGRTQSDPQHRGALQFTKARLVHVSPVIDASIPGTATVSVRDTDAGEDGTAAPATAGSELVEHLLSGIREAVAEGFRGITITVANDGTVSTSSDADAGDDGADEPDDDDAEVSGALLLQAVDGALDQAEDILSDTDISGWPVEAQQVAQLAVAAGAAIDSALEELGITDVDDDEDAGEDGDGGDGDTPVGERATLSTADLNSKPDSDFAYVEPGGTKDDEGKTVPRSKRHFYIGDADHVRNALSRIGQGAKFGEEAMPKVKAAAKKFGIDTADSGGSRSAESFDAELALARAKLGRR